MVDERITDSIERLRRSLTPGDLDHTLHQITTAAVDILPAVTGSSITVRHADGRLDGVAHTHDSLVALDQAQYSLQEGPCYAAATDAAHVVSPDLGHDPRFPRYAAVALEHGIRAQVGLRLFETPASEVALNLYSDQVGAFDDPDGLRDLFVHHSAVALGYAHEVSDLREALRARKAIGQAIGLLMERYELTEDRAFAFLTRLSSHRNVKLRQVAAEMVAEAEQRHGERTDPPRRGS